MSESIIPQLLEVLEQCESKGFDRNLTELNLAGMFLLLVLGADWTRKYILPGTDPDSWMMNANSDWLAKNPMPNDVRRVVHQIRVVRLANALFTIVSGRVGNAEILRKRLQTRPDLKATFIETEIASLLSYNGCDVQVIAESGKRGEDFDILVNVRGVDVSVEVTGISSGALSAATISNKLHGKRDQVPAHRPAVLYLHIPSDWMTDDAAAARAFTDAFNGFARRSQRFGMLVLIHERVLPLIGGGIPNLWMRPGYNHRARHAIPSPELFVLKKDRFGRAHVSASFIDQLQKYRWNRAHNGGG